MNILISIRSTILKGIFFILLYINLAVLTFAEVKNIDNQKLQLFISKGVTLVDIREEHEWRETGIIRESHLITFFDSEGKYDVEKWLKEIERIVKRDDPLIIICRSGRRSLIVANYLSKTEKFLEVYNAEFGIKGWKKSSLETQIFR